MKQIIFIAILALAFVSCEKETVLDDLNIPEEISDYVNTHFPDNKIIQIIKDVDELELTYDLTLEGSFSLEFNRKKQIISINGLNKLPDSVIPEKLLNYANNHYAEQHIVEWSLDNRDQEIKLDNGIELKFNTKGEFLRIDN
ncbi:MAG TPA: PepSY-like domain-containing protein [Prolixibacteraceae bacterium]|nr:PepSY-like domain-containing protein [Prolixibacteraceae bacterium]